MSGKAAPADLHPPSVDRRRSPSSVIGLLLAAGAGSRMGVPKALVRGSDGIPWLARGVDALSKGGCASVIVVLGAAAEQAETLLRQSISPQQADVVVADGWAAGLSASLKEALSAASAKEHTVAVVMLVDLPDVGAPVVERLLNVLDLGASVLARASYIGRPGHPVIIGREHWPAIIAETAGDRGASAYLAAHASVTIECGDLATGRDIDSPADPR